MNRNLEEFLKAKGAKPVDPECFKEYEEGMKRAIPRIEKKIRDNERRAVAVRAGIWPSLPRKATD